MRQKTNSLIQRVISFLNQPIDLPSAETLFKVLGVSFIILGTAFVVKGLTQNDPGQSAIMLVTPGMNSGGTGVILQSSETESLILTNDHVCRVIRNGGMAAYRGLLFQVVSYLEAKQSDLCLVKVNDDLGVNTKVASRGPRMYDKVLVSGFPALMPNIITEGHISGRATIDVVTEFRPCTEEEINSPGEIACLLLGGMAKIQSFESVLVSATIMPGSSGSGVYNASKELEGLVFAGSGTIGYGWTVPYEQLINFLTKEVPASQFVLVKTEVSPLSPPPGGRLKDIKERCNSIVQRNEYIDSICRALNRDLIWDQ